MDRSASMARARVASVSGVAIGVAIEVALLLAACGGASPIASPVPENHAAVAVAAQSGTMEEFSDLASRLGLVFACGEGGPPPGWRVCLVDDRGVVAAVGFDVEGLDAVLVGPDGDEVTIAFDGSQVRGRSYPQGTVTLELLRAGRPIGLLTLRR